MTWPPDGSPASVSPEAESAELFPSKKLDSYSSHRDHGQGRFSASCLSALAQAVESMMPLLSGSDDLQAQAQMSAIARQSVADLQGALRAATVAAQPYLSRGHSTIEHSWFRPTLELKGFGHVLSQARRPRADCPQGVASPLG